MINNGYYPQEHEESVQEILDPDDRGIYPGSISKAPYIKRKTASWIMMRKELS